MRFPLDVRRVYPDFVENCVATMEVRIFRCVLLLKAHFLFYQISGGIKMIGFKNFMKKSLSILIVLMICSSFVSCSEDISTQTHNPAPETIATAKTSSTTKKTTSTEKTSKESTTRTSAETTTTQTTQEVSVATTKQDTVTTTQEMSTTSTTEREYDYVLNTNSMKFHYPGCRAEKSIKDQNRKEYHGTRQSVIQQGYESCGICHP